MEKKFLTFNIKEQFNLRQSVRQWDCQAVSADPENIKKLASRFDRRAQTAHQPGPMLGFTVRALRRYPDGGGLEVCEFTYPMDEMPTSSNQPPLPISGSCLSDVVEAFKEYLAPIYSSTIIEILLFEKFNNVNVPIDQQQFDAMQKVQIAKGYGSLHDVTFGLATDPQLFVGSIVGSVARTDEGQLTVDFHEELLLGHLYEMISTAQGERVKLAPDLDALDHDFKRYNSFANREGLFKRVIRPDEFDKPEPPVSTEGSKLKL